MRNAKHVFDALDLDAENPIHRMFVIQAVIDLAHEVINNKEKLLKDMEMAIVAPKAWIEVAEVVTLTKSK